MTQQEKTQNNLFSILLLSMIACLLYGICSGIRSNYGIMINAISSSAGVDYATVSFILAVAQLVYGIMQPIFGVIALKKSNLYVLVIGIFLISGGLLAIPFCTSAVSLMLALGITVAAGTGALSFGIIMGAITPKIGEQKAAAVSGFVTAGSGIGSTILSPVLQTTLASYGIFTAMATLSAIAFVLLPLCLLLLRDGKKTQEQLADQPHSEGILTMLAPAMKNKTYLYLTIGFFTCGFHMAIIETHAYTQFISYGIAEESAALAFSAYGIAAMVGCIISGFLSSRFRMKQVLAGIYGARAVFAALFLLLPKSMISVFLFALSLGLTGASTVTPTSGLVSRTFGPAKLGVLFGICFFFHQIGSFFSSWLGGICVTATNSYVLIWAVDIVFCLVASFACFCIREEKISRS